MSQVSDGELGKSRFLIKYFAAATGSLSESLLGLTGAPEFLESFAGALVEAGTADVLSGVLSRRQRRNVETVVLRAVQRAGERCVNGDSLRQDDFLSGTASSFEEFFEGVLVTAQRNYESKKLEFLGNLVASLAFDTSVDGTTANWCVRTAESLSWTQLVLLSLADEDESNVFRTPLTGGRDRSADDPTALSVWEDYEDLVTRRLIGTDLTRQGEGAITRPMPFVPVQGGRLLIRLMELHTVTTNARDLVYEALLKGAVH